MTSTRILLIEDDAGAASALKQVLAEESYEVTTATRGDDGLALAQKKDFDVVITDLKLPGMDGLELIRHLHELRPRIPIILMTAHGTTDTAIEATKLGAFDYLLKPFEMEELLDLTARAEASSRLMTEVVEIGQEADRGEAIIGKSRLMQSVYKEIGRVAAKPVNVLIRGETGTGKELVARALYQHSHRATTPFVAVNCAAIPETLLESELFGHERGAFTGAEARRIGRFEQADGGTLFLDEIGDLSANTQVKLLRVLQEKCIQRLGGRETIPVDVRVLAATHRDLEAAIAERLFREDLYYRLSVVVIQLPPLRQRKEDLPDLVRYFLRRYGKELGIESPAIQADALQALQAHPWPGNVRELENVVRRSMLLARGYPVSKAHVYEALNQSARPITLASQSVTTTISELLGAAERGEVSNLHAKVLGEVEKELILQTMRQAVGNLSQASRWLGISRITLREKLRQYGATSRVEAEAAVTEPVQE